MLVGYGSTAMTAINFAKHGAYMDSLLITAITLNCIRLQIAFVQDFSQLRLELANTLKTGFMQPLLKHWLAIPTASKHALTAFIVAFSSMFVEEGLRSSLVQVFNYLLSVWTIAQEDVGAHLGDDLSSVGEALVRRGSCGQWKLLVLKCWSFCHISGSIALNALVMKAGHPLLGISLFLPCAWVKMRRTECTLAKKVLVFLSEPLESLTFSGSSVFGFPMYMTCVMQYRDPPNLGNVPAWPLVAACIFKCLVSLVLVKAHVDAFLQSNALRMFEGCRFEAFMISQALLTPLDIVVMLVLILINPSWRDGIQNRQVADTMLEIADELIIFEE